MQEALGHLDRISHELEGHALYRWIGASHLKDSRRHYDCFVPLFGFVMSFPFYNERYLAYGAEEAGHEEGAPLKHAINAHVQEDRTHARLFLADFRKLGLDELWGTRRASSLMWALWVSPLLDPGRAVESQRIQELVGDEAETPAYRYLHLEQLEKDGNLLFSATTRKAVQVMEQTGITPVYFGMHHLERESGHVGGSESEQVTFSAEQTQRALRLVERKHALSVKMNDFMHQFVQKAEEAGGPGPLLSRERTERLRSVREQLAAYRAGHLPAPAWSPRPAHVTEQGELVAAWERHHADFMGHPFAELLRNAQGPEAAFALRCAALLFAPRISALHAFYLQDCRVEEPTTGPGAQTVDFLRRTFSTEAELFFHDWEVLGMDARIPWKPAELLEFWFFDKVYGRPEMEALHEFRRETLRVPNDPLLKYWALLSIHFMSRAFFGHLRALTERFAANNPVSEPLVYLEGTHHLLYGRMASDWRAPTCPTSLAHLPVTEEQRRAVSRMMEAFATYGRRQFDNLARALTTDRERFSFLRESQDASTFV
ncbi:hypothetical protein [Melittangium boletus]|uniref:Uncharacterized protein n=1 Tax=Melittangium boletus DSM 14713 TaxID=1294270 RepID=A0A250I7T2_9BACT|nr:hypothetical protein [Melittangium boletus]ATB27243.1 hypothetical protein MEBOL_000681 [Melittangium boletus DSM 14713]